VTPAPLLVFDFDGVLVDGMAEYWWSARRAAQGLAPGLRLSEEAPLAFSQLRPRIHKGWEMVLLAAELSRPSFDLMGTLAHYDRDLALALDRWGWSPASLQQALEQVRRQAIAADRPAWLALHRFFPGVEQRLTHLGEEGADWVVLTTKGGSFAAQLLAAAELRPLAIYGHEQGSKPEVLAALLAAQAATACPRSLWFVEDRRPTLEQVRTTPGLEAVRCFLVSWGYLAPGDRHGLADQGITWLEPGSFAAPLAAWP
jgi:hypothetical protein